MNDHEIEALAKQCEPGDQWNLQERWREAGQDASVFDDDTDPDYIDLISDAAAKRALAAITPLLPGSNYALELRERLEGLERFGLREDAEHPGFSEVGPVPGGAFLRCEQVFAALDRKDSDD